MIFFKGHELDGSIGKYADHHCPITLVQAKEAFFLWHGFQSCKHSCKERSEVSLMWHRVVKINSYWRFMLAAVVFTEMFVMGVLGLKENLDSVQRSYGTLGTASCNT